jgi:S-adenosylmethionine-diacylglycerol 3-amino-3-carboxypropyl transferase
MSTINYSQCWEDTNLLKRALTISNDDVVLSITSGGDNTLALLLENPKKIFSIDINSVQNHVAELKLQSSKVLSHEEYLELLGVIDSRKRMSYYTQVSELLSVDARLWFEGNMNLVKQGVIHSGKFEKYLNSFRKYVLPLVHSKQTISQFINQSNLQDQIAFYEKVWNTWRWKFFFSIATSSSLLKKYARQTGTFAGRVNTNQSYLRKLERLIYRNHLKTNPYINYALTGEYGDSLPDYLSKENYAGLQKHNANKCEFRNEDLLRFLKSTFDNSLTKYNLSDAFEFLTIDDALEVWREIIRTAKNGAKVVYWCNQIEHTAPREIEQSVLPDIDLKKVLEDQDRLYFYRSFHIYTITK